MFQNIVHLQHPKTQFDHGNAQFDTSFMKLGLTIICNDVRNGVGSEFQFSKFGNGNLYDLY